MGHSKILGRIVWPVDAVTHVRGAGEGLEAVQKARRNEQVVERVVIEAEGLSATERRRFPSDVDEHVVDGAIGASDEFRLARTRPAVHTPDHALGGPGLGILHERRGGAGSADMGIEDVGIESPREQAATVARRLRHQDENICQIRCFDSHKEMLP